MTIEPVGGGHLTSSDPARSRGPELTGQLHLHRALSASSAVVLAVVAVLLVSATLAAVLSEASLRLDALATGIAAAALLVMAVRRLRRG